MLTAMVQYEFFINLNSDTQLNAAAWSKRPRASTDASYVLVNCPKVSTDVDEFARVVQVSKEFRLYVFQFSELQINLPRNYSATRTLRIKTWPK